MGKYSTKLGKGVGGKGEEWIESPALSCFFIRMGADSGSYTFLSNDMKSHKPVGSLALL